MIPLTIFPSFPTPQPNVKKIPTTITLTLDRRKEEWDGVAQIVHFDDECILNSAKLDATPSGFRIGDELQGGMYEQNRTAEVIAELVHYPFQFLPPDKVGDAFRHHPGHACKSSEEGW